MSLLLRGYLLLGASLCVLVAFLSVVSLKLLSPPLVASDASSPLVVLLAALQADDYYVFLVPMLLPVGIVFVYVNWLGLKLYRHN